MVRLVFGSFRAAREIASQERDRADFIFPTRERLQRQFLAHSPAAASLANMNALPIANSHASEQPCQLAVEYEKICREPVRKRGSAARQIISTADHHRPASPSTASQFEHPWRPLRMRC